MDKSKIINYQGKQFAVGLNWKEFSGSKPSIIRNKIKEFSNRNKYDGFGAKIDLEKGKIQVGFATKKEKNIPSMAKIFAGKEEYLGSLILAKIENDLFWAGSITEEGLVVTGYDVLYSEDKFIETIGDFLQIEGEGINIFIAEDSIDEISVLLEDSLEGFEVQEFDVDETFGGNLKNTDVEQIYNPAIDNVKQLATFAMVASVLTASYFYVYQENGLYHTIINEEVSAGFAGKYAKYKKKGKNKNEAIDEGSYENLAKTEIIKLRNTTYNNEDIINYMNKIFSDFPLYLVEWELVDINYQNHANEYFSLTYNRIANSFGYREQLEEELRKILKDKGYETAQFGYPNSKGDSVQVNIMFKKKKEIVFNNDKIDKSKLDKEKLELERKLEEIDKEIDFLESSAFDLGFSEKRFGSTLEDLEADISSQVSKGNKILKQLEKQKKEFSEQKIDFNDTLISGSRAEMLSMMQKHSYYSWKESNKSNLFPSNVGKSTTKKKVDYYAQSYDFSVEVGSNIDIIGLTGLKTILVNDNLLNKPYIKINDVSFSLNSEVWSIKGESYEKL